MIVIIHSLYFLIKYYLQFVRRNKCTREFLTFQSICKDVQLQAEKPTDFVESVVYFDPPVYKQRYAEVQDVLLNSSWRESMKKIVDFGCAEFGLFPFLKRLFRIVEILEVDIDETLLRENLYRIQPLTMDYLNRRTDPLVIEVLVGSISNPDKRLIDTDVVIGIEIIEHLYPDTLDALPYNVFNYIKPKLVIFTTPNADFNCLFPNFSGFRHNDHKFEWTREQFEAWAENITERFPDYSVTFKGIGEGPLGTELYGCCSQMAVFEKIDKVELDVNVDGLTNTTRNNCIYSKNMPNSSYGVCTYLSCTSMCYELLDSPLLPSSNYYGKSARTTSTYYKLVETVEYPYEPDNRTTEEKILDEMKYRMCLMGNINGRFYNDDLNRFEIPVIDLIYNQQTHYTTIAEASEILTKAGYKVEECVVCDRPETCVIYEPVMASSSASSISRSTTPDNSHVNDLESEWSTITTENEASDWGDKTELNIEAWPADIQQPQSTYNWIPEKEQLDLENDIAVIIESIIANCQTVVQEGALTSPNSRAKKMSVNTRRKGGKSNESKGVTLVSSKFFPFDNSEDGERNLESISEQSNVMNDSGYCKSATILSSSDPSSGNILDSDDQWGKNDSSDEKSKSDKTAKSSNSHKEKSMLDDKTDVTLNIKDYKMEKRKEPRRSQSYDLRNGSAEKLPISRKSPMSSKANVSHHNTSKGHLTKDNNRDSIPGTSSGKRKKKLKRIETDDDDDDSSSNTIKSEDVRKVENGIKLNVPEVAEVIGAVEVEAVHAPVVVVENGDLANNNRDVEGNNYPDAPRDMEIDNENVVLQNVDIANGENQRNEDVENRNEEEIKEEDDHSGPQSSINSSDVSDFEIEFASREALFDPNSQVDLLEEYSVGNPPVANTLNIEREPVNPIILVVDGNADGSEISEVESGPIAPRTAEPFPNWLLQLLGTEIGDDIGTHDEPHFYCQGDGIGVHPSFIDEDFEDGHSSSGSESSTSSGSSNDDAEAEPTVSEEEVNSLPDDSTDSVVEQVSATNNENLPNVVPPIGLPPATVSSSGSESEYFDTLTEASLTNTNNRSNTNRNQSNTNQVQNKN